MLDAKDPVCGATVEVVTAYSEAVGGQTYYFCSENCRQRFDEDPAEYAAEGPTSAGGFVAPRFGSAGSGGAEYEPIPEQQSDRNPQR